MPDLGAFCPFHEGLDARLTIFNVSMISLSEFYVV